MKNITLSLIILSSFLSCQKDELKNSYEIYSLNEINYNEAKEKVGPFIDFFVIYNSGITTESELQYVYDPVIKDSYQQNTCFVSGFIDANNQMHKNRGDLYVDNIKLKYKDDEKQYPVLNFGNLCNDFKNLYGKKNSFKLIDKNGKLIFSEEQYIPMQFTTFGETNVKEKDFNNYPVFKGDIKVEWNADLKNDKGIAAVLSWDGFISGKDVLDRKNTKSISRILWLKEDSGFATIPNKFYSDLPKGANFNVTYYRGAARNISVSNEDGSVSKFNLHNRIKCLRRYVKG